MAFTKNEIISIYKKRAKNFDFTSKLYAVFGFNDKYYRQLAVNLLELSDNDNIVELGCGTGLNFIYLQKVLKENGALIGIDISNDMLEQAELKIKKYNWQNVELLNIDVSKYIYPKKLTGVISTFAITLIPEYEDIIKKVSESLLKNKKFVILDLKKPNNWPLWLVKIGVFFAKPFGVTMDLANRKPWEIMEKYFDEVKTTEYLGGIIYITIGTNYSK